MASVFFRGPKSAPRWYARIKAPDGRWISRRVRQQTRKDALRVAGALEARAERQRVGLEAPESVGLLCGPLMKRWAVALSNRGADIDRGRVDKHVLPRWRSVRLVDVTLSAIMGWLDEMSAAAEIGPASRRHCLGLLSRFMSWATERGHAPRNPCRDIPAGKRPRPIPPRPESVPWIRSDDQVVEIIRALGSPWDAMFFLGNRSGLRLGEILGLRLGDLDEIGAGAIRVAHSYAGPLKEDRHNDGKTKWVPSPTDAAAVLEPILAQRRAAGAGPDQLVFVDQDGDPIDRHAVAYRWRVVREALGLPAGLSFYKGTRHSFASRALASGAGVDEIASALGHSSPAITARHYLHHVRKRFSPILCAGLGLDGAPGAKVLSLTARNQATETPPAPAESDGDEQTGGRVILSGRGS